MEPAVIPKITPDMSNTPPAWVVNGIAPAAELGKLRRAAAVGDDGGIATSAELGE